MSWVEWGHCWESPYGALLPLHFYRVENHIHLWDHWNITDVIDNLTLIWLFDLSKRMANTLGIIQQELLPAVICALYRAVLWVRLCAGRFLYANSFKIQSKSYVGVIILIFLEPKWNLWDINSRAKVSSHISLVSKFLGFPIHSSRHLKMWKEKPNSDIPGCFTIIKLYYNV